MELHETFLRIACPICGCEMSATDMKSNGDTDDGMFEQYRCGCGAWFTVTVEIDRCTDCADIRQTTGSPSGRWFRAVPLHPLHELYDLRYTALPLTEEYSHDLPR